MNAVSSLVPTVIFLMNLKLEADSGLISAWIMADRCNGVESNNNVLPKLKDIAILKNGVGNSALFFLIGFAFHLIIDNYLSYGIVKQPLEIITIFYDFFTENRWIFATIFIGFLGQISICFTIEKLLSLKILSDGIGLILHLCNLFLLVIVNSVIIFHYKFNPVASHIIQGHSMVQFCKIISFIYVNNSYRNNKDFDSAVSKDGDRSTLRNGDTNNEKSIRYPHNLTVANTFDFFVGSGTFIYSIGGIPKIPRNWKKVVRTIGAYCLIHFVCAFIAFQYLIPELEKTRDHVNNFQILHLLRTLFKLWFPVNVLWLIHYQFWCFSSYLPLMGWFWGTKDYIYFLDWWNAENVTVYWRKWNYQTHLVLKYYFFLPLKNKGYSKTKSALLVAFASGLLHEILVSIPCRGSWSLPTIAMLAQVPLAIITGHIQKNFGPQFSNFAMLSSIMCGNTITIMTLFYNYNY